MENKETLMKAVKKATDNGWDRFQGYPIDVKTDVITGAFVIKYRAINGMMFNLNAFQTIFSHDFAKALWRNDELESLYIRLEKENHTSLDNVRPWQMHLRQMVTADDPIKYLADNI